MTDSTRALSFGSVSQAYDRGRPEYPRDAVDWLVGGRARQVLDLGAGTGKLTATLIEAGHDVFAVEPDESMLEVLAARLPEVRATLGSAEAIPVADAQFDVVVVGQAFHWFDQDRALPEIARVLKTGGHLSLVWNRPDTRIPWVRKLMALVDSGDVLTGAPIPEVRARTAVEAIDSPLFGQILQAEFKHRQQLNAESVLDFALSRSSIASLADDERAAKLDAVGAFYADYGRGMDGMQLPYLVDCFRLPVIARPSWAPAPPRRSAAAGLGVPGYHGPALRL